MVIELYGNKFAIYGFPVIEGNRTYAYATDQEGNVFYLFWPSDKEPVKGNVQIVKLSE